MEINYRVIKNEEAKEGVVEWTVVLSAAAELQEFFVHVLQEELVEELVPYRIGGITKWENPGLKIQFLKEDANKVDNSLEKAYKSSVEYGEEIKKEREKEVVKLEDDDEGDFQYFEQSKDLGDQTFTMFDLPKGENDE